MASLSFAKNAGTGFWEAVYSGESGALHLKRKAVGGLAVYGDVGLGFSKKALWENPKAGDDLQHYLDMTCLKRVKIVSVSEVMEACVNPE